MLSAEGIGQNKRIPIPDLYKVVNEEFVFREAGTLKPMDLFIDKSDNIYIADTGNNRISN